MTEEDPNDFFEGGCHCGRVRFRVRGRTKSSHAKLEALDCNCSICTMKGFLHFIIVTLDDFELLAGSEDLTTYTFNTRVAKHTFCRVCGIHPFYTPRSHPNGVDVNVRCLDGGEALIAKRFAITRFNGSEWEANVDQIR